MSAREGSNMFFRLLLDSGEMMPKLISLGSAAWAVPATPASAATATAAFRKWRRIMVSLSCCSHCVRDTERLGRAGSGQQGLHARHAPHGGGRGNLGFRPVVIGRLRQVAIERAEIEVGIVAVDAAQTRRSDRGGRPVINHMTVRSEERRVRQRWVNTYRS